MTVANDKSEWDELLTQHYSSLWSYAFVLSRTHHDASDLAQETCTRAMTHSERLRDFSAEASNPSSAVKGWLLKTCRNAWISNRRSSFVRTSTALEAAADVESLERADSQALSNEVLRACLALPAEQRDAIALVNLLGHSHDDAAQILEIDRARLRYLLVQGRRAIAKSWKSSQ